MGWLGGPCLQATHYCQSRGTASSLCPPPACPQPHTCPISLSCDAKRGGGGVGGWARTRRAVVLWYIPALAGSATRSPSGCSRAGECWATCLARWPGDLAMLPGTALRGGPTAASAAHLAWTQPHGNAKDGLGGWQWQGLLHTGQAPFAASALRVQHNYQPVSASQFTAGNHILSQLPHGTTPRAKQRPQHSSLVRLSPRTRFPERPTWTVLYPHTGHPRAGEDLQEPPSRVPRVLASWGCSARCLHPAERHQAFGDKYVPFHHPSPSLSGPLSKTQAQVSFGKTLSWPSATYPVIL